MAIMLIARCLSLLRRSTGIAPRSLSPAQDTNLDCPSAYFQSRLNAWP